ncbi:hypothetical protein ABF87_05055 [Nitrosomonas sp. JL21]|uniref:hypothetical protein n=1 Tax=Nitrosomonas sp. JL21 TaxID=153949 RepID=UPI00136996D1|nr:hypothetical protein [Nitrosomonas sp. JL21]MBL8496391.1 hypothetical protein [Nitrosomonas sp.]MCC7091330.1 hypothetical protein [Nitrosomonas sp.]MXS77337.1 hypothetical protein [Nitrosomonas sp. JL21]
MVADRLIKGGEFHVLNQSSRRMPPSATTSRYQKNQLEAFIKALKTKLLDRKSGFGKEYLKLLVNESRIKDNQIEITGSYSALAHLWKKQKALS